MPTSITYTDYQDSSEVYLDKKHVGTIKKSDEGWQYTPKGQKTGGDYFNTRSECKHSLEYDD